MRPLAERRYIWMPARFWLWMFPSGTSAACPWSLVRRCRASILTRHVSCGGICACGPDYHLDGEQAPVVVPKSLSKGQQWIRYVSLGSSAKSLHCSGADLVRLPQSRYSPNRSAPPTLLTVRIAWLYFSFCLSFKCSVASINWPVISLARSQTTRIGRRLPSQAQ